MTHRNTIRARAQEFGIHLVPAIKQAGVVHWWLAADNINRTDPEWRAAESLIDWSGTDPAVLFEEAAKPVARSSPVEVTEPVEIGLEPPKPTMWQRAKGWLGK